MLYLSGGAGNQDPALSLGGIKSNTLAPQQLLGDVPWSLTQVGIVDFLCVYAKNIRTDPLDVIAGLKTYIQQQLTGDDDVTIQYDPAGVGNGTTTGVATVIADRYAAPAGVTFPVTVPVGLANALPEKLLLPGECVAIWIKRTVPALAASKPIDQGRFGFAWGF